MRSPDAEAVLVHIGLVLAVLLIVSTLWYGLWKGILEKNDIVRDFFDLDRASAKAK